MSLRRGQNNKRRSNAKPVFLLTIMSSILEGKLTKNEIHVDDEYIKEKFVRFDRILDNSFTDFHLPFFCLEGEPFYRLIWRSETVMRSHKTVPSAKYLRENVLYAKFDDELWALLQDKDCCRQLMKNIRDCYFPSDI